MGRFLFIDFLFSLLQTIHLEKNIVSGDGISHVSIQ